MFNLKEEINGFDINETTDIIDAISVGTTEELKYKIKNNIFLKKMLPFILRFSKLGDILHQWVISTVGLEMSN